MWTSHEKSHEQAINKVIKWWASFERIKSWTSREQDMKQSRTRHEQVMIKLWIKHDQTPYSVNIEVNKIMEPFHFTTCPGGWGWVGVSDKIKAISAQLSWSWGWGWAWQYLYSVSTFPIFAQSFLRQNCTVSRIIGKHSYLN